ncbi:SMI1/KNR4 family protein [Herbidospora sp. NBRC 101105]|uniref:SMI1/KNR4 family protein n=1 Tax=Herbidospora sp. NBRC 101105 TaxID=3032195 RepID=UPI0025541348|nr:SMI1/KNR4 family protein [Herbidospora sp. NBRC 101105]
MKYDWAAVLDGHSEGVADVAALEARLEVALPPSYRAFLLFTDGITDMMSRASEVGWFPDVDPETFRCWAPEETGDPVVRRAPVPPGTEADEEYLSATLKIGEFDDDGVILLNPLAVTDEGEWEAWHLAAWIPGVHRFPSFWDLWQKL